MGWEKKKKKKGSCFACVVDSQHTSFVFTFICGFKQAFFRVSVCRVCLFSASRSVPSCHHREVSNRACWTLSTHPPSPHLRVPGWLLNACVKHPSFFSDDRVLLSCHEVWGYATRAARNVYREKHRAHRLRKHAHARVGEFGDMFLVLVPLARGHRL